MISQLVYAAISLYLTFLIQVLYLHPRTKSHHLYWSACNIGSLAHR
jgi:hypothetical protein